MRTVLFWVITQLVVVVVVGVVVVVVEVVVVVVVVVGVIVVILIIVLVIVVILKVVVIVVVVVVVVVAVVVVVVSYRRFGTTCWSNLQECCPETSVKITTTRCVTTQKNAVLKRLPDITNGCKIMQVKTQQLYYVVEIRWMTRLLRLGRLVA
jgi:hypothetical protein